MDPHPRDPDYSIAPITSIIQSLLANHFRNLEHSDVIGIYKKFSKIAELRGVTGMLFEALGQQDTVPVGKPQWSLIHTFLLNAELEATRQEQPQHSINSNDLRIHLNVRPIKVVELGKTPPSIKDMSTICPGRPIKWQLIPSLYLMVTFTSFSSH